MGGRVVRMCASLGVVAALFASSASAAGNANPPDASCQTNAVVRSIMYLSGVAYLAGDFTRVAPAGVAMGGAGTVTRDGLAACSETTGKIMAPVDARRRRGRVLPTLPPCPPATATPSPARSGSWSRSARRR